MIAGTAKIDITPQANVWMDGMIRAHKSTGVHDRLFARALVMANDGDRNNAFAVVSVDVAVFNEKDTRRGRQTAADKTNIPADHIVIAATHNHSGPATFGYFSPVEKDYVEELLNKIVITIDEAANNMRPAVAACGSGREDTISHYRRLLADDGHVVMNWEPYPAEHIVGPLGEVDPEVGVLKITEAEDSKKVICLLFNHAGHPNVMSGDNYLLSADYPGFAAGLLEDEFGETAIFVNGAQGTMDIDGLKDRDWEGVERAGRALAGAVSETARSIMPLKTTVIRGAGIKYKIPIRKITDAEWTWAQNILKQTGGKIEVVADGVGDDYKALCYKRLRETEKEDIPVEQICFAVGNSAFISFPGELFTEIGMCIKARSPFRHTYIIGLANWTVGYVPTRKAIKEGGFAVDIRQVNADAEDIIVEQSLALLQKVYELKK